MKIYIALHERHQRTSKVLGARKSLDAAKELCATILGGKDELSWNSSGWSNEEPAAVTGSINIWWCQIPNTVVSYYRIVCTELPAK